MTTHDNETDEERTARNGQLTQADVSKMFAARQYDQISQARADGKLAVMMNGEPPLDPDKVITSADVTELYRARNYDAIERLRKDGRLNALLGSTNPQENNS